MVVVSGKRLDERKTQNRRERKGDEKDEAECDEMRGTEEQKSEREEK